jgi:putative acetyltransferase
MHHHQARMVIRRDRPEDHDGVRAVLAAAFADADAPSGTPVEIGLVDALRASDEWLAPLSLVALGAHDDDVTGYVVCSRGWVAEQPALGLGPLAVAPGLQGRGIGAALMHAVLGGADALGEPLVALVGHREYYPRFGFRPAADLGIEAPDASWGSHFQTRSLTAWSPQMTGVFRYARPFEDL